MVADNKNGSIKIPLAELQVTFNVRKELNQDHVLFLAELYDSGVELPPLQVTDTNEIIEGRHRKSALELAGRKEADCIVVKLDSRVEMIAESFKANVGGALPPSRDDIEHTIALLLEQGVNRKTLLTLLPFPAELLGKYIDVVKERILSANIRCAARAVIEEGLTVAQAAKKYGVTVDKLKAHMRSKAKEPKKYDPAALKSTISSKYHSLQASVSKQFSTLLDAYDAGEIPPIVLHEIGEHIGNLNEKLGRKHQEYLEKIEEVITASNK